MPKKRVLLVEDEPMITLLYEDVLQDSEFELVASLTCNRDALAWIDKCTPDVAIVDYVLSDGPCHPVVDKLKELSVPVLVASGYTDPPEGWEHVTWLEKPFPAERLLSAVRSLAGDPESRC
jgi:DNA-binding response OmpR family regulator